MSSYPGHVIETVGKVCDALNTEENPKACGYEDVQYMAETGGKKRCISSHEGTINGAAQMKSYSEKCPDSHLILMGFSQGAGVLLDVLGGGGGEIWGCTQKPNPGMNITSVPGSMVAAALVFGSPIRSAGKSWTHGGGDKFDGSANRTEAHNAGLQPYADAGILREYCQSGDPICAPRSENQDMENHMNYFDRFGDEAATWVVALAQNASSRAAKDHDRSASNSGALNEMVKMTISHPFASAFLALIILGALYLIVRITIQWKTSSSSSQSYAPVNTSDTV